MTTPITVPDAKGRHDLLRHDPGASPLGLQRPYLELDPEGRTVALDARCQCETGEPEYVWHGRSHRYPLPVCVDPQALVEWLRGPEAQALLRRICEGHSIEWDGCDEAGARLKRTTCIVSVITPGSISQHKVSVF